MGAVLSTCSQVSCSCRWLNLTLSCARDPFTAVQASWDVKRGVMRRLQPGEAVAAEMPVILLKVLFCCFYHCCVLLLLTKERERAHERERAAFNTAH